MVALFGLLATGLWLFVVIDCFRNEPDRQLWLLILIFLSFPGILAYLLIRVVPRGNLPLPSYFSRWTRSRELWVAEQQAQTIGKAYQYIHLGNLLYEMSMYDRAENAFQQALSRESDNTQALWGAATVDIKKNNFISAKGCLESLLKLDPEFKYGDASLAYGETLFTLKELDAAKSHLENHIKYWSHPQGYIKLAEIYLQQGNKAAAKNNLETIISKVRGSSYFHYKRNRRYIGQAERLLRKI